MAALRRFVPQASKGGWQCRGQSRPSGAVKEGLAGGGRRAPKRAKIVVFCDNARYYRSSVVREYLGKSRAGLRFLPPYAPNLNPIERQWRLMKESVCHNRHHATLGEFRGALLAFFARLADKYRGRLATLITTNFHVIAPKEIRVIGRA